MHRAANIGIITGKVSKLVVIDYDMKAEEIYPKSQSLLKKHLGDSFVTSKTGKGFHVIIRTTQADEIRNIKVANRNKEGLIETRGEGGYIVAPPSIHPDSGTAYQFTNCKRINDLSQVSTESVKKLLRDLREEFHHEPKEEPLISFDRPQGDFSGEKVVENLALFHKRLTEQQAVRVSLAGHGTRHSTLLSAAGVLASFGINEEKVYRALFSASTANGAAEQYGGRDIARTISYGIKNADRINVIENPFVHLGVF